jgi:N-hydroxyarylamine O-acetyltransferase
MTSPIDLDAYFDRIAYRGPRAPTLEVLNAILLAHVQAIPFENLDVLLQRRISLDFESLQHKLIHARRGGYCFEQNGYLLLVLEALGFSVRPISARVRVGRPRDYTPARTHLFLRIQIAGQDHLADVGVGGMSPTSALRLLLDVEQATPHEPRRLIHEGGRYFHQVRLGNEWSDVCEFTLEEMPPIDRELANWYTSAHPQSHFKHRLIAARATPEGRITLLNRDLTFRARDGKAALHRLESPRALLSALDAHFGLRFPEETVFACEGLLWS